MQIIKLDAIDSTNLYLKNLMSSLQARDYTVVVANTQTKGRGQMGTIWDSESGKNLTFSVLKLFKTFEVKHQFLLNIATSLAVYTTLNDMQIPDLKIKWPNDILSGNNKICGILIENILSGTKIQASVIGIGLNINQIEFNNLVNVSSLKLLTGIHYNLDEVLLNFMKNLEQLFETILTGKELELKQLYLKVLFKKDKVSTFKNDADQMFTGIIRNVNDNGKLLVEKEDEIFQEFDLKEIKLLY
ncbi:biotin--[acetyl-CoA-carboxylase] ligase [Cellulophaga tyrosinoxydans]|uniref:BirA family transcriptional regulator, biotin operon repressor / biotin-[acetyl-CoA-carboxylase] ligase n=1 Tax=Cellulophaga tyrosinoxydans TaxID=504486 RepID=A0A1W1Y6L1_9FLAO|nr:biotin--[acetyl-CoA-carboxylase] ligase [Cellulophaga tyrosinoxydans]SMC31806.1 BirA family transcriptional regulator, biotin operon repressor / biotin-[acetyl-CoA-carboxylase] ligase [Cellulophaga tyrosinoxydans]